MNDVLNKAISLVFSSERRMPAHFTTSGERTQSFCIDFEPLRKEDDYEMASESWYTLPNDAELTKAQHYLLLRCGEDIMVGAFILEKFGGKEHVKEMADTILRENIELYKDKVGNLDKALSSAKWADWLAHCAEFGISRADRTFKFFP